MLKLIDGVICTENGQHVLNRPTVMFDRVTGTLHAWGDFDYVLCKWLGWRERDTENLVMPDIVMYTFNTESSQIETVLEELNKMISTAGYCHVFYKRKLNKEV